MQSRQKEETYTDEQKQTGGGAALSLYIFHMPSYLATLMLLCWRC